MRKLNLLFKSLFLLCALIVGSSAWANVKTNTSTASTKFSANGDVTSKFTQTGTYTNASWNLDVTWKTNASWQNLDNTKGAQIGSSKSPATSIVLTGSNISGTISSVVVNTSGANGIDATVGVKVGTTAFQCNSKTTASLSKDASNYSFTGSASGNIVITWTNSSDKAIYIKSITVTFDDGGSQTITTVSFPQEVYTITFGDSFSAPVPSCNSTGTKTYTSSNTNVAEVNSSTGELTIKKAGNTTITLNVAENASYTSGSASYDLIVKGVVEDGIFDFAINQDYGSNAVPGTDPNQTTETTWTAGKVTLAVAGRNIWYNGNDLRLYKETAEPAAAAGNITISVPSGYYMTRIDLTGGTNLNLTSGGGAKSGTRWSGKSQSVKFTHNGGGTITLTKIKVYYCTESEFNEKVNVTINTNDGWMTYCYKDANLSFGNLEAYVVSAVGESSVTLTKITKAPAGTALILKGAQGSYELTKEANADVIEANRLGLSSGSTTSNDSRDVYALANKNGVVGFYLVEPGVKVPEGKCYISINKPSSAREFLSIGDDATGIKAVEGVTERGVVYDLQGRRVAQPTRGLYIENGKKVIIK